MSRQKNMDCSKQSNKMIKFNNKILTELFKLYYKVSNYTKVSEIYNVDN